MFTLCHDCSLATGKIFVAPTYSMKYALMTVVHGWSDFISILRLGLYMMRVQLGFNDARFNDH